MPLTDDEWARWVEKAYLGMERLPGESDLAYAMRVRATPPTHARIDSLRPRIERAIKRRLSITEWAAFLEYQPEETP